MAALTADRQAEILQWRDLVHEAGRILVPDGTDADRMRALVTLTGAASPTVKHWWCGQNAPRGAGAVALKLQLHQIIERHG